MPQNVPETGATKRAGLPIGTDPTLSPRTALLSLWFRPAETISPFFSPLLSQRFVLRSPGSTAAEKEAAAKEVRDTIFAEGLSGHYVSVCTEMGWTPDQAKLAEMKERTSKDLAALEEKINDAIENLGDSEVKDALTAKAEYICKIGAPKEERKLAFKVPQASALFFALGRPDR